MTGPLCAAELTRELVRFKTINPPGDELPCARYIGGILEAAGFETVYHPMGDNRANLIARLGGRQGKRPICFSGHTDVVPLGQREWSVDPFAAEVKDGRIYGRGSTDMKGGVAAIVAAAVRLAPRLAIGPGVVLVITAGEERGCEGANFLAKRGLLPWAGAMVIAEPTSNRVCAGHKGVLWLEGISEGVTAHGSTPEMGDNAVYKAARAVLALADIDLSSFAHPILGKPTVNVGWMRGGMNVNSVPDEARFGVDLRIVPEAATADLLDALRQAAGPDIQFEVKGSADAVWTEANDNWVQQVLTVASSVTGETARLGGATYFTDAGALKPGMGSPPAVILGPGDAELAHQTDESCSIARIAQAQTIYEDLIANWCEL
jgi:succinyl-diaminopimelate desuccinylase